jgi:cardiolipin synthase
MEPRPEGRIRDVHPTPGEPGDRILTIPNALSVLRLVLVPVFLYLLLGIHADAWAVAVLMVSGFSDWADGKIARLVDNQSSRLGALLDPAVDRIYMLVVPVAMAIDGIVPWWIVLTLIGRDAVLAATLPVLRSRGLTALPVTYIGKAATFALMSGLPLILLGQWDALWSRIILAIGWAFLIWGMAMYLWSAVLYLIQVVLVVREMPRVRAGGQSTQARLHRSDPGSRSSG